MATNAEGVKAIRRKKREQALCVTLGCNNLSGSDSLCQQCADKHAALMRRQRAKKTGQAA